MPERRVIPSVFDNKDKAIGRAMRGPGRDGPDPVPLVGWSNAGLFRALGYGPPPPPTDDLPALPPSPGHVRLSIRGGRALEAGEIAGAAEAKDAPRPAGDQAGSYFIGDERFDVAAAGDELDTLGAMLDATQAHRGHQLQAIAEEMWRVCRRFDPVWAANRNGVSLREAIVLNRGDGEIWTTTALVYEGARRLTARVWNGWYVVDVARALVGECRSRLRVSKDTGSVHIGPHTVLGPSVVTAGFMPVKITTGAGTSITINEDGYATLTWRKPIPAALQGFDGHEAELELMKLHEELEHYARSGDLQALFARTRAVCGRFDPGRHTSSLSTRTLAERMLGRGLPESVPHVGFARQVFHEGYRRLHCAKSTPSDMIYLGPIGDFRGPDDGAAVRVARYYQARPAGPRAVTQEQPRSVPAIATVDEWR
jgi:hypothetical protein